MAKEINLFDENEDEVNERDFTYDLTPYHFNMDVDGLLRRFEEHDIMIPQFQRNYVWEKDGASMFIDSVLRGLPTPSLFFYEESPRKYLVIDGQQRLLTLYYFIKGIFPDKKQHQSVTVSTDGIEFIQKEADNEEIQGTRFTLSGSKVHHAWKGKTFKDLTPEQQKTITNTYVYIVNLKQTVPAEDNSSMYMVFERINTGSTRLNPQQIRLCVSHGKYAEFLCKAAQDSKWKKSFNLDDKTGIVSELILRFISLFYVSGVYKGSMKAFLDKELKDNKDFHKYPQQEIEELYSKSFFVLHSVFDAQSFTLKKTVIGYFLLVTWISIANILNNVSTNFVDKWTDENKEKLRKAFEQSKNVDPIRSFISDTRRASKTETLQMVIESMTNCFRTEINDVFS